MEYNESGRYDRQILLPEIGIDGQRRLREARVLIVGAGGLGSPIALYLAGAGVGHIGLVDDDVVSLSNLHRQVLYGEAALDKPKAAEAVRRLRELNGEVCIVPHACRLTRENAAQIVAGYDVVADGCDNYATRFVIDDVCAVQQKPYVYGAVCGWEGQASVFHYGASPRRYRDLYPDERATCALPPAAKEIIGTVPGVVGCVMAQQVIALLCGAPVPLAGKLWSIDLCTLQTFAIGL